MLVFFEISDFSARVLGVYHFTWAGQNGFSGLRPFHALSLRLKGDARLTQETETVEAHTGDLLFVPANCPYHMVAKQEEVMVIHFESADPLPASIRLFTPVHQEYYRKLFEEMEYLFRLRPPGYALECRARLYQLAAAIERDAQTQSVAGRDALARAEEYMREHFADASLSVGRLAEYAGVSEVYFRRIFSARYGEAPVRYLRRLRLDYALELLRSGYYSVTEVAEKSGFSSPYYFSAFVKAQTGASPLEWKQGTAELSRKPEARS